MFNFSLCDIGFSVNTKCSSGKPPCGNNYMIVTAHVVKCSRNTTSVSTASKIQMISYICTPPWQPKVRHLLYNVVFHRTPPHLCVFDMYLFLSKKKFGTCKESYIYCLTWGDSERYCTSQNYCSIQGRNGYYIVVTWVKIAKVTLLNKQASFYC